jgi:hypothetical protein
MTAAVVATVGALLVHGYYWLSSVVGGGSLLGYFRHDAGFIVSTVAVAPVPALVAGTLAWRWVVPAEPDPRRGAIAGVVTALGALLGVALLFGAFTGGYELVRSSDEGVVGVLLALPGALGDFLALTAIVFVFGALITGSIIVPLGALAGWGYERTRARLE